MKRQYPRRLIENDLPVRALSEAARAEKSARHRHICTLHIWWARRPLAACRAVLLASLLPDPGDPLCPKSFRESAHQILNQWRGSIGLPYTHEDAQSLRNTLFEFIKYASVWKNSTRTNVISTARALLKAAWPEQKPLVIDPFAGGGSIPLEALRVGADAFASDLNPVAVLLLKTMLSDIPKYGANIDALFPKCAEWIRSRVAQDVGSFYAAGSGVGSPIAYHWARTIICEGPGCGARVPLIGRTLLATRSSNSVAIEITGYQDPARITVRIRHGIRPSEAGEGTVRRGSVTCPVCGYTTQVEAVRRQISQHRGGASSAVMTAVTCAGPHRHGKTYREPTKEDLRAAELSSVELRKRIVENRDDLSLVPDEPLPPIGTLGFRTQRYGMSTWGDFFTPRQALVMSSFSAATRELRKTGPLRGSPRELQRIITTLIAIAVDRVASYCASTCLWVNKGEFIGQVFSQGNALPMRWDFVELAPLANGPGNWVGAVKWVSLVVNHIVSSNIEPSAVELADAADIPLPNDCAAAMVTDPPYYDAIAYADLSDYFYVWLKRSIGDLYPDLFSDMLTHKTGEIIVNPAAKGADGTPKDKTFFETAMTRALAEGRRVLKPDGIAVIVFAHKSTSGWEAMLQAILDAGWSVTASWPIDTERPGRLRARNSAALGSSIHIVCRPRENPDGSLRTDAIGEWRDVLDELPGRIHEWMPRLAQEGVVGADAIFACLGPALEIYSRYSRVERADGTAVPLGDTVDENGRVVERGYLSYVWEAVSKEALSMIFEGADTAGFEADARLTAMWLWTLSTASNGSETPTDGKVVKSVGYTLEYDAARKIAQGLGVHLERLGNLVEIKGNKARLLPVAERTRALFGKEGPSAPRRRKPEPQLSFFDEMGVAEEGGSVEELGAAPHGATVLSRVHQAMLLFATGRSEALRRFLVEEGVGQEARFWRLAQALSALYPAHTDEKRWVDGVLGRKKGLGF